MPREFDVALAGVAAKFPTLCFVGPKAEVPGRAVFVRGGPHLTKEGNAEVAKAIAAYFVNHQRNCFNAAVSATHAHANSAARQEIQCVKDQT